MNWKSFLKSAKDKAWERIAQDIGAQYEQEKFWHKSRIFYNYKKWTLLLDHYSNDDGYNRTRLRVPYVTDDQFRFKFQHEDFLTTVGKYFGMQDIQIHDLSFDQHFLLRGSDENKVKRLLADHRIKNSLLQLKICSLEVVDDDGLFRISLPTNVLILELKIDGLIKDSEDIKAMFRVMTMLLDRMIEIGSALPYYPNFRMS